jgi:hypothetical protein
MTESDPQPTFGPLIVAHRRHVSDFFDSIDPFETWPDDSRSRHSDLIAEPRQARLRQRPVLD